jgi:hypothetical protein
VITRLSSAARSLRNMLAIADELRKRDVDMVALAQQIDTTTPGGPPGVPHPQRRRRVRAGADRRRHA